MNTSNVWANFGLRASPFFNQPLEPNPDHPIRPINLFVGREDESQLVINRVEGAHSSAIVVTGGYGVGKTTFLHYIKFKLSSVPHVRVPSTPVRVMSTTNAESLSAEVLRRLLAAVREMDDGGRIKTTRSYKAANDAVTRVDKWSGSLSFLGVGGGVSKATVEPPHPVHDIVSLAYELAAEMMRSDSSMKVLIHIDNIENVHDPTNPERGWLLFRDIRDLLQIDGVHMMMGGALEFYRSAIHREQKVADVVGAPVVLSPLDGDLAWRVLERRIRHLARVREEPVSPISREAFDALHDAFSGNLRGMFTIAGLSLEARPPDTKTPVEWDDLVPAARGVAMDQVSTIAGRTELEYLRIAYSHFGDGEFRQVDLSRKLDVRQPTVSKMMDRLMAMRLIEVVREDPPSRFVRLSGTSLIAFGWSPR